MKLTIGLALTAIFAAAPAKAFTDLKKVSVSVRAAVEKPESVTRGTCTTLLNRITKQLDYYYAEDFRRDDLVRDGKSIIENFWKSRLAIRSQMVAMSQSGGDLTPQCVSALRNSFRAIRYFEEYVALHLLPKEAWVDPKPTRVFSGGFPALELSPAMKKLELRSGDVLVSYGMAYGSAAIAHLGPDSGTFSHMAIVHVDQNGTIYTIEAHPEFGVKVAPLEKYLGDEKGRSAVFRHRDPKLAAAASKRIFDITSAADWSGHPIPYDFRMELDEPTKLFCSEVVKYAYDLAASDMKRAVKIPAYPTVIAMKNPYVMDAFDIKTRVSFLPGDIEVDPQFELLAEWRDVARTRLIHQQQAAIKSEFTWLDTLDYNYRSSVETKLTARLLYTTRHLPLFDGFVNKTVPGELSDETLEAVVQVYFVSDVLRDQLSQLDKYYEKNYGTLMTASQTLAGAETARIWDRDGYLAYKRWEKYGRANGEPPVPGHQWHFVLRSESERVD